jgi:hypothetical protein
MWASQQNLEGVLTIVSNLVMKEELHSSITTIIRQELGPQLDTIQDSFTKLSNKVHTSISNIGHRTSAKIHDLETILGNRMPVAPTILDETPKVIADTDVTNSHLHTTTPIGDRQPLVQSTNDPPQDIIPVIQPSPGRHRTPPLMNTATDNNKFHPHNSHFGTGIDLDGPMTANARSQNAYAAFHTNNPDLAIPRPPSTPPTTAPQAMIIPGPIVSPRNRDRDFCAREFRANQSDIKALVNIQYHCGIEEGFDSLTPSIIAADVYSNIGSDDVVACHNNIIEMHRHTMQLWHNPIAGSLKSPLSCSRYWS